MELRTVETVERRLVCTVVTKAGTAFGVYAPAGERFTDGEMRLFVDALGADGPCVIAERYRLVAVAVGSSPLPDTFLSRNECDYLPGTLLPLLPPPPTAAQEAELLGAVRMEAKPGEPFRLYLRPGAADLCNALGIPVPSVPERPPDAPGGALVGRALREAAAAERAAILATLWELDKRGPILDWRQGDWRQGIRDAIACVEARDRPPADTPADAPEFIPVVLKAKTILDALAEGAELERAVNEKHAEVMRRKVAELDRQLAGDDADAPHVRES